MRQASYLWRELHSTGRAGISIYADPLINKVYYNLMENTIRHGGHVTAISVCSGRIG